MKHSNRPANFLEAFALSSEKRLTFSPVYCGWCPFASSIYRPGTAVTVPVLPCRRVERAAKVQHRKRVHSASNGGAARPLLFCLGARGASEQWWQRLWAKLCYTHPSNNRERALLSLLTRCARHMLRGMVRDLCRKQRRRKGREKLRRVLVIYRFSHREPPRCAPPRKSIPRDSGCDLAEIKQVVSSLP